MNYPYCAVLFSLFETAYHWSLVLAFKFQDSIPGLGSFPRTSTKIMGDVHSHPHGSLFRNTIIFSTWSFEAAVWRGYVLYGRDRITCDDFNWLSWGTTREGPGLFMNNYPCLSKTAFNSSGLSGVNASKLTVSLTTSSKECGVTAALTTGTPYLGSYETLTVRLTKLTCWT